MKTEEQNQGGSKSMEGFERTWKSPQVSQRGCIREFLQRMPPQQIKEETGEGLLQRWEVQWQEFLKTMEASHSGCGVPQLLEESTPWDDAKAFLASFEQVAEACQWPKEEWVARLLPALSGEAKQAYSRLDLRDREDYGKLKAAILRGDAVSREKKRQHFRHFCYLEAEGPRGTYSRLQELCRRWLKVERHSKEQILEFLILEQFLTILPPEVQNWVREREPETCSQAVALAEDFLQRKREAERQQLQVTTPFEEVVLSFCEPQPVSSGHAYRRLHQDAEESKSGDVTVLSSKGWISLEGEERYATAESERLQPHGTSVWRGAENVTQFCPQENTPGTQQETLPMQEVDASVAFGESFQDLEEDAFQRRVHTDVWQASGNVGRISHQEISDQAESHRASPGGAAENFSWCQQVAETFEILHGAKMPQENQLRNLIGKSVCCGVHKEILDDSSRLPKPKTSPVIGTALKQNSDEEMLYQCTECSKCFAFKKHLIVHRKTHIGNTLYDCSACEKRFAWVSDLTRHQRIHTGEKPFACPLCGRQFSSHSSLINHRKTHGGERPFQCPDCGKRFVCKSHLTRHQKVHLDRKSYACSKCSKSFCQISLLILHKSTHAEEELLSQPLETLDFQPESL
ncbi:zinc finger and SCAN domain-containing protein 22-like [Sphaerodactylus townsendi]|uniref:zinc finger and SCAN domain-containing protein 22-like n=1 Tax=Sphaerodactylus townsendi TaxID=933632 RepID=UPI0020276009|nr:zinc finger and SCAN domain-containing protein 22-like [Sphaerodactylus townsendi]